eukprot:1159725-Pelagomonas_calceolata.AAC.1
MLEECCRWQVYKKADMQAVQLEQNGSGMSSRSSLEAGQQSLSFPFTGAQQTMLMIGQGLADSIYAIHFMFSLQKKWKDTELIYLELSNPICDPFRKSMVES